MFVDGDAADSRAPQITLYLRARLVATMGRTLKRKARSPPPTQDYDELERRLAEQGDVWTYRPNTTRAQADEWGRWEQ